MKKIHKKIEKALAAFSLRDLQNFINIHIVMESDGLLLDDIKDYVVAAKREITNKKQNTIRKADRAWKKMAPKCPECGASLYVEGCTKCGKSTPKGNKSMWYCRKCNYTDYSPKTVREELRDKGLSK